MDVNKAIYCVFFIFIIPSLSFAKSSTAINDIENRVNHLETLIASAPILHDISYMHEVNKTVVEQANIKADVEQLKIRVLRVESIYALIDKKLPKDAIKKEEFKKEIESLKKELNKQISSEQKEIKEKLKSNKESAEKLLSQTNILAQKAADSANSTRASFDTLTTIFFTVLSLAVSIGGLIAARTARNSSKAVKEAKEAVKDVTKNIKNVEIVNAELTILHQIVDFKDNHGFVVRPPQIRSRLQALLIDGKEILQQLKKLGMYKAEIGYDGGDLYNELFGSRLRVSSTDHHSNLSYIYSAIGVLSFHLKDFTSALKYFMLSLKHDNRGNPDRIHNVITVASALFKSAPDSKEHYYDIALRHFSIVAGDSIKLEKLKNDEDMPDDVWHKLVDDYETQKG